jgi:hypothetical protein
MKGGQFQRLADRNRRPIRFRLDGGDIDALEGDTLLTAILLQRGYLRKSEFGADNLEGDPRAGFCLMGACQDCWIWRSDGTRLRACSAYVTEDLNLRTSAP